MSGSDRKPQEKKKKEEEKKWVGVEEYFPPAPEALGENMERTGSFLLPAALLLVSLGVTGARADTFKGKCDSGDRVSGGSGELGSGTQRRRRRKNMGVTVSASKFPAGKSPPSSSSSASSSCFSSFFRVCRNQNQHGAAPSRDCRADPTAVELSRVRVLLSNHLKCVQILSD